MITPGDIRLVWFPFSRSEPQPYKKRPVLILATHGAPPHEAVIVAMVTGNPSRFARPGPGDVPLADWQNFGLDKPSVIRTRRIWTAEARDFTGTCLGKVDPGILQTVRVELRNLLS